jgi:hypothetical protein
MHGIYQKRAFIVLGSPSRKSTGFCHQSLKKKQNDDRPVITCPVIIFFDDNPTDDNLVINKLKKIKMMTNPGFGFTR